MFSLPLPVVSSTPAAIVAPATESARFCAEVALFELAGTVRALRLGLAPFDVLTPEERAEQLVQLLDDGEPAPDLSRITSDELIALVGDTSTPHKRLVAALREIDRRLETLPTLPAEFLADADAPDAAERQRIESEDEEYAHELTLRRERDVQRDTVLAGRTGWAEDGDAFNSAFAG